MALPALSNAAERQTALSRPAIKAVRPTQAVMVCVARAGLRLVAGGLFPGWELLPAPFLEALLWPLVCWVLLAPQRRPPDKDENRPL